MATPIDAERHHLRPAWLTDEQWPYPIRWVRLGTTDTAYTDTGTGPPLLLVHTGMWSFVWRDLVAELQQRFRVVVFDAPSTGLSTGPSRPTIDLAAEAVDAVVTALDLNGFVLGFHDLGGPTALTAAARWPDRVTGLVALNSFGWRPHSRPFRAMLAVMGSAPIRGLDVWTGWLPRASATRFGAGRHWNSRTRRTFRRPLDHRGRRSFHHYMRSALRHEYSTVQAAVESTKHLPLLTVFGARNDPLGFQSQWAQRFPNHTRTVIRKGYHFPMCDQPTQVADTITRWHQAQIEHQATPPDNQHPELIFRPHTAPIDVLTSHQGATK